ncbi:MAG: hypothetical protein AAB263_00625 [Planctomycetota bacterium]
MHRSTVILISGLCVLSACAREEPEAEGPGLFSDIATPAIIRLVDQHRPQRKKLEPSFIDHGERATLIFPCAHQRPEVLNAVIKGMIGLEGSIETSSELNALIVTETKAKVTELQAILAKLDVAVPQLLVEARLVELTMDSDVEVEMGHVFRPRPNAAQPVVRSADLTLGTPGSAPLTDNGVAVSFTTWGNSDMLRVDTFFRALIKTGKARILSSPNVLVSAGTQASITTGEEVPIFETNVTGSTVQVSTKYKQIGVKLKVKALQITNDGAEVEFNPEVSTVTGVSTGPSGATSPIFAVRQLKADLRLKDGEILSVGGLLRVENRESIRKIPLLGDIPLLGWLFRSTRQEDIKTQLVFFLRIHVIDEGRAGEARVHKPGIGMDEVDASVIPPEPKPKQDEPEDAPPPDVEPSPATPVTK